MRNCLVVFCKPPIPGQVKTRLAADVGPATAAQVYETMLSKTATEFSHVEADLRPYVSEDPDPAVFPWTGWLLQQGADLGERMSDAFTRTFDEGYQQVLLCGTDIPGLTAEIISEYFAAIEEAKMVLGPTHDGGYYLIGFTQEAFREALFVEIPWSTSAVFSTTLETAGRLGLKPDLGPKLRDLDTLEDALRIAKELPGPFSDNLRKILSLN